MGGWWGDEGVHVRLENALCYISGSPSLLSMTAIFSVTDISTDGVDKDAGDRENGGGGGGGWGGGAIQQQTFLMGGGAMFIYVLDTVCATSMIPACCLVCHRYQHRRGG